MQRLISIFLILSGLLLVGYGAFQAVVELAPAFQPTATPEEVILEQYAPGSAPLITPSSQPQPVPTASPAAALYTTEQIEQESGTFLGQAIDAQPDLAPSLAPAPPFQETPLPTPLAEPVEAPTPVPVPTATEIAEPAIPTRIVIPAIGLDAPVLLAGSQKVRVGGGVYYQWTAPNQFAAGWHTSSASLGQPGNTVLSGHNNIYGKVFGALDKIKAGDTIEMYSGERLFRFVVANTMILPEKGRPIAERLENARWIGPSDDVRLTLITCWPEKSNTHRLIIVAVPDNPAG